MTEVSYIPFTKEEEDILISLLDLIWEDEEKTYELVRGWLEMYTESDIEFASAWVAFEKILGKIREKLKGGST